MLLSSSYLDLVQTLYPSTLVSNQDAHPQIKERLRVHLLLWLTDWMLLFDWLGCLIGAFSCTQFWPLVTHSLVLSLVLLGLLPRPLIQPQVHQFGPTSTSFHSSLLYTCSRFVVESRKKNLNEGKNEAKLIQYSRNISKYSLFSFTKKKIIWKTDFFKNEISKKHLFVIKKKKRCQSHYISRIFLKF